MKKNRSAVWIGILITLIFVALSGFVFVKVITHSEPQPEGTQIVLDETTYNTDGKAVELAPEQLDQLISEQKSFVVYVSLPLCTEDTALFREYVNQYQRAHNISFYFMTSDKVKNTPIYETVKYFPSVIIYEKGELKKYLDFNSDADVEYYKSEVGFSKWFETNVDTPWTK